MMPDIPLISIVIPTYNRPELARQAVDSVRGQTDPRFEIVLVADGCRSPVASDAHLRVIRTDVPQGVSGARNLGAKAAEGEWIVFLDDDDLLRPSALEAIRRHCLSAGSADWCWGARRWVDESGEELCVDSVDPLTVSKDCGDEHAHLEAAKATSSAGLAVRTSVFHAVGGFDPDLVVSEDRISLKISTEVSELTNQGALTFQSSAVTDDDGNTSDAADVSVSVTMPDAPELADTGDGDNVAFLSEASASGERTPAERRGSRSPG